MKLFFAPLQGYTDHLYRNIHNQMMGGIDSYFSPFLRLEGSALRGKDLRDILPENNTGTPLIPQVIANGADELAPLLDVVQQLGYHRVDLNLGCPFPMQTSRGRGAALLARPEKVEELVREMEQRRELQFSVKMRSGMSSIDEGLCILRLLNDAPLDWITIHPRLCKQQYKGVPDRETFMHFLEISRHPIVYNGDITKAAQIDELQQVCPTLYGVMIGRGLLARPTLAQEWHDGEVRSDSDILALSLRMHSHLFDNACQRFQGDQQILSHMRAYWEYQQALLPRKSYKIIMRTTSLRNYEDAVASLNSLIQ